MAQKLTKAHVYQILISFLDGTGDDYDFDDFICVRVADPFLETIRRRCASLPDDYPPEHANQYCSDSGLQVIRELTVELSPIDAHGKQDS